MQKRITSQSDLAAILLWFVMSVFWHFGPAGIAEAQLKTGVIAGQIRDRQTQMGLPGTVSLFDEKEGTLQGAKTDDDGKFRLSNLSEGEKFLMVHSHGYGYDKTSVTLTSGEMSQVVFFELNPTGSVSGRVVAEDGTPVKEAIVRCIYIDYPVRVWHSQISGSESGEQSTNALGEFFLPEVKSYSKFFIEVTAPGYSLKFSPIMTVIPTQQLIDIDISLEKGPTFSGIVTDPSGNPLAGARVSFRSNSPIPEPFYSYSIEAFNRNNQIVFTGADGRFAFKMFSADSVNLFVALPRSEFRPHRQVVDLDPNGPTNLSITLQPR